MATPSPQTHTDILLLTQNSTPWSKGQAHCRKYPLTQRNCERSGLGVGVGTPHVQNTCSHNSAGEQGKLREQTKRVTRRADAEGGGVLPSKPSPGRSRGEQTTPRCGNAGSPHTKERRSTLPSFPCRFVQANSPQGSFGQMGENQEDQGGGAPWQAGHHLDAARQRSIRAMVARLHPPALPFSHLSAHIQPRLGFKQKDPVWLPQKHSCPRSPLPRTPLLFMRTKRGPESLPEVQQMWSKAFPDARAGIDAVHPLVLSGLPEGCLVQTSTLSGNPPPLPLPQPTPHNYGRLFTPKFLLNLTSTVYHISHTTSSDVHCSTEQPGTRREGTTCGITRRGCVSTTQTTGATASRTAPIAPLPMAQTTLGRLYTTAGTKLWDD